MRSLMFSVSAGRSSSRTPLSEQAHVDGLNDVSVGQFRKRVGGAGGEDELAPGRVKKQDRFGLQVGGKLSARRWSLGLPVR